MSNGNRGLIGRITNSITDRLESRFARDGRERPPFQAAYFDDNLREAFRTGLKDSGGYILQVKPHKDSGGIRAARELMTDLHRQFDPTTGPEAGGDTGLPTYNIFEDILGGEFAADQWSFEIWYHGDNDIQFFLTAPSKQNIQRARKHLADHYPKADVVNHGNLAPDLSGHKYVCGTELEFAGNRYDRIYAPTIDEGNTERDEADIDPYKSLTSEIANRPRNTAIYQITFTAAEDEWDSGRWYERPATQVADNFQDGKLVASRFRNEWREVKPGSRRYRRAEGIREVAGKDAYNLNIRVFTFAPSAQAAVGHTEDIAQGVRSKYARDGAHTRILPWPYYAFELEDGLYNLGARHYSYREMSVTPAELASLAHIPNDSVNANQITFTSANPSSGTGSTERSVDQASTGATVGNEAGADGEGLTEATWSIPQAPEGEIPTDANAVDPTIDPRSRKERLRDARHGWRWEPTENVPKALKAHLDKSKPLFAPVTASYSVVKWIYTSVRTDSEPKYTTGIGLSGLIPGRGGSSESDTDDDEKSFKGGIGNNEEGVSYIRLKETDGFENLLDRYTSGTIGREWLVERYNEDIAEQFLVAMHDEIARREGLSPPDNDGSQSNTSSHPRLASDQQDTAGFDTNEGDSIKATTTQTTTQEKTTTEVVTSGAATAREDSENDEPVVHPNDDDNSTGSENSRTGDGDDDEYESIQPANQRGAELANHGYVGEYDLTVTDREVVDRKNLDTGKFESIELTVETEEEGIVIGQDAMEMYIKSHEDHPDQPIWLGTINDPAQGRYEVGIPEFAWNLHGFITGVTGAGKSVTNINIMTQIARKGYGFLCVDPDGGLVDDLLLRLPADRMDDVILIEPDSLDYDKTVGINFLDVGEWDTKQEFHRKTNSVVEDLTASIRGEEYWGNRMNGIVTNLTRGMIRLPENYTLIDMYHILTDQEALEQFADALREHDLKHLTQFTDEIAEMDREKLEPLIRRIQKWAEDPISRSVVAHRESTININEAVQNNKIILLKLTVNNDTLVKTMATAVMRRVWSVIRDRKQSNKQVDEYDPYFAFIDELHKVLTENLSMKDMLALARSGRMGVFSLTQNIGQIEDKYEGIARQMMDNTYTQATLNLQNKESAREMAEQLGPEYTAEDITEMGYYNIAFRPPMMEDGTPSKDNAVTADTFPLQPKERTREEVQEKISQLLEEDYGVEPLGQRGLRETEMILDQLGDSGAIEAAFLASTWTQQLQQNRNGVKIETVIEGFQERTGREWSDVRSGVKITDSYIEVDRARSFEKEFQNLNTDTITENKVRVKNSDTVVRVTKAGRNYLKNRNKERAVEDTNHNSLAMNSVSQLAALGAEPQIVPQAGSERAPDGRVASALPEDIGFDEVPDAIEELKENSPHRYAITGPNEARIESETQTWRKGAEAIKKLAFGKEDNRRVVYVTPETELAKESSRAREEEDGSFDVAEKVRKIFEEPSLVREKAWQPPGSDEMVEQQAEILYNRRDKLPARQSGDDTRKFGLIRRQGGGRTEAVWVRNPENPGYLYCYDGVGETATRWGRIKTSETEHASTNAFEAWCMEDTHNDEWIVYPGGEEIRYDTLTDLEEDWLRIPKPCAPDQMFSDEPDTDDYTIMTAQAPVASPQSQEIESGVTRQETPATTADGTQAYGSVVHEDEEELELGEEIHYRASALLIRFERDADEDYEALKDDGSLADSPFVPHFAIPPEEWDEHNIVDDITDNPGAPMAGVRTLAVHRECSTDDIVGSPGANTERESDGQSVAGDDNTLAGNPESEESDDEAGPQLPDDQTVPVPAQSWGYIEPEEPLTPPETDIDQELADQFSTAKDPTTLDFWMRLWSEFERDVTQPVRKSDLPGAIQQYKTMRADEAENALELGYQAGLLLEGTAWEALRDGKEIPDWMDRGTGVVALAAPRIYPGIVKDDLTPYLDIRFWKDIWNKEGNENGEGMAFEDASRAIVWKEQGLSVREYKAITAAAIMKGTLQYTDDGEVYLGTTRFNPYWREVWKEQASTKPEEPLQQPKLVRSIAIQEDVGIAEARKRMQKGLTEGTLVVEEDGTRTERTLRIADPSRDEGVPEPTGNPDTGPQTGSAGQEAAGQHRTSDSPERSPQHATNVGSVTEMYEDGESQGDEKDGTIEEDSEDTDNDSDQQDDPEQTEQGERPEDAGDDQATSEAGERTDSEGSDDDDGVRTEFGGEEVEESDDDDDDVDGGTAAASGDDDDDDDEMEESAEPTDESSQPSSTDATANNSTVEADASGDNSASATEDASAHEAGPDAIADAGQAETDEEQGTDSSLLPPETFQHEELLEAGNDPDDRYRIFAEEYLTQSEDLAGGDEPSVPGKILVEAFNYWERLNNVEETDYRAYLQDSALRGHLTEEIETGKGGKRDGRYTLKRNLGLTEKGKSLVQLCCSHKQP